METYSFSQVFAMMPTKRQERVLELSRKLQMQGKPASACLELAVGQDVARTLEQATTAFEGIYTKVAAKSVFAGIAQRVPAAKGFAIIADLYPTGQMEAADGQAKINTYAGTSYRLETALKWYTMGIDFNTIAKIDNIFDNGFQMMLGRLASMVVGDEDRALTAMLLANTAAHIGATASFFSATNPIPGTSRTFSNLVTGITMTTAAGIRIGIRNAQKAIMSQLNAVGDVMANNPQDQQFVAMFHNTNLQFIEDAFVPGNLNGVASGVLLNDAAPLPNMERRYNNYLTDGTKFFVFIKSNYPALVVAEQEAPNMISTLGQASSYSKLMNNRELAQVRHAYKEGYGSPFSAVEVTT